MSARKTPRTLISEYLDASKTQSVQNKRHFSISRTPDTSSNSSHLSPKPQHGRVTSLRKRKRPRLKNSSSNEKETPRQLLEGFLAAKDTSEAVQRVKRRRSEAQEEQMTQSQPVPSKPRRKSSTALVHHRSLDTDPDTETPRSAFQRFLDNVEPTYETPLVVGHQRTTSLPSVPSSASSFQTPSPFKTSSVSSQSPAVLRSSRKKSRTGNFHITAPLTNPDQTLEQVPLPKDTSYQTPSPFKSMDLSGSDILVQSPRERIKGRPRIRSKFNIPVPDVIAETVIAEEEDGEDEEEPFRKADHVENLPDESTDFAPPVFSTQRPTENPSSIHFSPRLSSTRKPEDGHKSVTTQNLSPGVTDSSLSRDYNILTANRSRMPVDREGQSVISEREGTEEQNESVHVVDMATSEHRSVITPRRTAENTGDEEEVPPTPFQDTPTSTRKKRMSSAGADSLTPGRAWGNERSYPQLTQSPMVPQQSTGTRHTWTNVNRELIREEEEGGIQATPYGEENQEGGSPLQAVTPSPVVSPQEVTPSPQEQTHPTEIGGENQDSGEEGANIEHDDMEEVQTVEDRPPLAPVQEQVVQKKPRKPRNKKVNKYSMPVPIVKKQFTHFAGLRVSKDAIEEVMKVSELYWDQLGKDLDAYCRHAGRKTITNDDLVLLFKRQRHVTATQSMNSLIEKYLPMEYREKLIPVARSGNKIVPKL